MLLILLILYKKQEGGSSLVLWQLINLLPNKDIFTRTDILLLLAGGVGWRAEGKDAYLYKLSMPPH